MYYCHQYFRLPLQRPHTINAKILLLSVIVYLAIRDKKKQSYHNYAINYEI